MVVEKGAGGRNDFKRAHRVAIVVLTDRTSCCIFIYPFSVSFVLEVRMEERDNELATLEIVDGLADFIIFDVGFPFILSVSLGA